MVAVPVGLETAAAKLDNFGEQLRSRPRADAQGFKIACPGRLHMEQLAAHASKDGVRGELVRAAMDTDLVRATMLRDGHVLAQRGLELLQIALVIDALFKIADKPRRDADNVGDFVPSEFQRDKQMLERTGWLIRFIHADLQLEACCAS